MLVLVDVLLVGDDPKYQFVLWLVGWLAGWMDVWELNPKLGSLWLNASATLEGDHFG
jgi:hypothetical protein